ncbi:hypothetical protein A6V39_03700 [Candidatus Mycoplasma haematobovis]|uniref:Uncharacterized protein n=1 Tax=Candidatus Mycoplasma haematobovis TaxID=432608 RepID=A0A1A9QDA3_9MOLU|nr:hypothetical protein [Candidatus Mycoplasma haematobovis]OAL09991.1 hypothetical protein A6V39_03700 [Candidatus Mycoplasma haematobovis]
MDIKSLAAKSTIGLVGLGGLGAGGYYGISALNGSTEVQKKESEPKTPSIEEALRNEGYTLLSEDSQNNDSWNTILSSYKTVIKQHTNLAFENFTGEEPAGGATPTAVATLKQKCKDITVKDSNNKEMLKKARKWCVTPIDVAKLLKAKGFNALQTNIGEENQEKNEWTEKIKAYRTAKKNNSSIGQFVEIEDNAEVTPQNIAAAKTKCQEFAKILSHADTFETSLSSYEAWCGNKKE